MSDLYLLDTHVFLWAIIQPERLASDVRTLIKKSQYALSVATLWELINKKEKRDAPVKDPRSWWEQYVTRLQTTVIPIRTTHVIYLDTLPWHHRDPYDRILVAQSSVEKMPLVTADTALRQYGIDLHPAI